jgi:hypothetical protein
VNVRKWPLLLGELPPARYEEIEQEEARHQEGLLARSLAAAQRIGLERVSSLGLVGAAGRAGTSGRGCKGSRSSGDVANMPGLSAVGGDPKVQAAIDRNLVLKALRAQRLDASNRRTSSD